MTTNLLQPYAYGPDEGEAIWLLGGLYTFKALGAQTANAYSLVEVRARGEFGTPLHAHEREEEGFYVVDGAFTIVAGEDHISAPAGTFAFAPRGLPHGFQLDSQEGTILLLLTPGAGGHEGLFREMGEPAAEPRIPPPPTEAPDPDHLASIASRHGTTILGPLPDM